MPIKIAIVGCGEVAIDQHLPAIRQWSDRIQVIVTVDIDKQKADKVGNEFKARSFSSLDDALKYNETLSEKHQFNAVILLLPHHLHKQYALKILDTVKYHLLLEKPIAMDLKEANEILEAARKNNKVFLVGENAPHWPEVSKMRELIKANIIGDLVTIKGYLNYPIPNKTQDEFETNNWRLQNKLSGGGIISDGGLHWIRALRELMDEEATSVYAHTSRTITNMEGESFGHAIIKFKSGRSAILTIANVSKYVGEYNIFEILGTSGHIVLKSGQTGGTGYHNERDTKLMLYNNTHPQGVEIMKPQGYSQSFVQEYGNFLDAIEHKQPLKVTPESTAQDLSIALAMYKSAQLKQDVDISFNIANRSVYQKNTSTLYCQKINVREDNSPYINTRAKL